MPFWQPNCSPSRFCDGLLAFDNQVSLKFVVFFLKKMYFYTYNHRSEHVYPTYLFVQSTYKRGVFYVCRLYKELSFILLFFLQSVLHKLCVIRLQRKGESGRVSVVKGAVLG